MLPPVAALLALLIPLALAAPRGEAATALYSFGDSLSDRGNARIATGGVQPLAAFYSDGRFTNGPIWLEGLADVFGLPAPAPSLAGGTNFAIGGARTGVSALTPGPRPNDLPAQVDAYLAGPEAPAGALFTLWIGANDIVFSLLEGANLALVVPAAVNNTLSAVLDLAIEGGARDLLVLGVPDLGQVPALSGNPLAAAAASMASALFNQGLAAGLAALPLPAGTDVDFLDIAGPLSRVVAAPDAFGFTDASTPCFTGASFVPGTVCSADPAVQNGFLFWDGLHPTAAGHGLVAALAIAEVPAPPAAGLVLVGLAGLLVARRRG